MATFTCKRCKDAFQFPAADTSSEADRLLSDALSTLEDSKLAQKLGSLGDYSNMAAKWARLFEIVSGSEQPQPLCKDCAFIVGGKLEKQVRSSLDFRSHRHQVKDIKEELSEFQKYIEELEKSKSRTSVLDEKEFQKRLTEVSVLVLVLSF